MSFKPVSVIVCCYNKMKPLKKTLSNTMPQVSIEKGDEVIVADGLSTDGVEKMIARDFAPEVQFVQVKERKGWNLQSVRNLGIKTATNDLIIIFDADTIPQPETIEILRERAEKGTYLSGLVAYEVPRSKQEKMAKKHGGMAASMYFIGNYPIQEVIDQVEQDSDNVRGTIGACMCFHKQDALDIGLFDEEFNGCWGYGETSFIVALHFNGVKIVSLNRRSTGMAIVLHQRHKYRKKWQDECVKKNRALLRSKLPAYRRKEFDV